MIQINSLKLPCGHSKEELEENNRSHSAKLRIIERVRQGDEKMAKAKLVKRKKRLRIDRLASMMMVLAICLFLGAKYGLQSYNYSLSLKKTQIEAKNKELSQAVADLQSEVTNLQSREHVLSVAEKDNIKTNQKNVTLIGDSKE